MGYEHDLTPHIDRLVQDNGVIFEKAFACINATDPSVTTIHSGHDPSSTVLHHGPYVTEKEKNRIEAIDLVPELLHAEGIHTVGTGRPLSRWHKSGFDEYPEPILGRTRRRVIGERLGSVHPQLQSLAGWLYERVSGSNSSADDFNDLQLAQSIDTEQRFYGFVHLMDTHAPYEPSDELVEELLKQRGYPTDDLSDFFDEHQNNDHVREFIKEHASSADYEYGFGRLIAKYDATVMEADQKIGDLIEELRRRGLYEETTIIVTSDHGESLDEHGIFFDHHGLYDESIHVPLVISGPETQPSRRKEFVQLHDIAPTVLELFDVTTDSNGEGRSLEPLLTDNGDWANREYIIAREAHAQSRVAVRTAEWKYIKYVEDPVLEHERGDAFRCGYCDDLHGSKRELYNLNEDPDEMNNVVEMHPEAVSELEETLTTWHENLNTVTADSRHNITYSHEAEVLDRLEDLGYR
jgi:arylsulfatase A-like enzyme